MASSSPIKNKSGVVYAYQIKVYRGRDADGKQLKPYSTVWKIPDGIKNLIGSPFCSSNNARKGWCPPTRRPLRLMQNTL